MEPLYIIILIFIVILGYFWIAYNSLITARMRVKEAFSGIDVQLKRRTDLIPNLVETVKGYAKHEKEVFEGVTKARTGLMSAKTTGEKEAANNMLTAGLTSLFAVAENYPNLQANQNFLQLQQELSDTENKIAYSRQFYNSNVLDYNTKLSVFPTNIYGNMLNFKPEEFFEAEAADKKPVKVSF